MQLHPSFGNPFAKPHQWVCLCPALTPNLSLTLDLGCWLSLLKERILQRKHFATCPVLGQHRGGQGLSDSPMEALESPETHRDLQVHRKAHRELWGTPTGKQCLSEHRKPIGGHLNAQKVKPSGLGKQRHTEADGTEWHMGSVGGTRRPNEGFEANQKAHRGS